MTRRNVPPDRQLPPGVDVAGFVVVGCLQSAAETSATFADRFEEQLASCGITDPEMGEWYPATALQDALFQTDEAVDESALVDAGAEMARLFEWPDTVSTVGDALSEMTNGHEAAHRNVDSADVGRYELEQFEDRLAVIACRRFPYPVPVARGAIRGTVESFIDDSATVTVSQRSPNQRDETDDDTLTRRFEVSW